jgi:hypothetical protein
MLRINSFYHNCTGEIEVLIKALTLNPFLLYGITDICFEHERLQMGDDDFWIDNNYSFLSVAVELFIDNNNVPF